MRKKDKFRSGIEGYVFGMSFWAVVHAAVLIVLSLFIYPYKMYLSAAMIGAAIVLFAIEQFLIMLARKSINAYLKTLSFCIDSESRRAIVNLPVPSFAASMSGKIVWYNDRFESTLGLKSCIGKPVSEILKDVQITRFAESSAEALYDITFGERDYNVIGHRADPPSDASGLPSVIIFYLIDRTDYNRLNIKFQNEKTVQCIIMIDNYDEALSDMPDSRHRSVTGEIEQALSSWVNEYNGVLLEYEKDKFFAFFEAENFRKIADSKFSVLTDVRNIGNEHKIPVTLSIGVGLGGEDIAQNDDLARVALDMALGRGGDQAVVNDGGAFNFYGAKSGDVEKRTRVKVRVVSHALRDLIDQSDRVIIMGHKRADMDCIGAAAGLYRAVVNRGRKAYVPVNRHNCSAPELIKMFEASPEYDGMFISGEQAEDLYDDNTLVIVVDTHRPSMVENSSLLEMATKNKNVVLIDHHRKGQEFISNLILSYHEPYASSTCEMVVEILQYIQEKERLTKIEATALYAGMFMDTKGFTMRTGVRTFDAASYLRRMGVDTVDVKRMFRSDLKGYVKKSQVVGNAEIYRDLIAISSFRGDKEDSSLIAAQAADELLNINNIEASFVAAITDNKIVVSGRSLGMINVQIVLEKLGGGGHQNIAGAQFENVTIVEVIKNLKEAIDEAVQFD